MAQRSSLRTPLLMLFSLAAGAVLAGLALRGSDRVDPNDLLASDPATRAAAFAALARTQWDARSITQLETAVNSAAPAHLPELAERILGSDGPAVDRLSDALRLHLAEGLAGAEDPRHLALLPDLLGAPLASVGDKEAARLLTLVQIVFDRAEPSERDPTAEHVFRCILGQLELSSVASPHPGALRAPEHRPDLAQLIDLAASWRLSPGEGAQRRSAETDPPGPGFLSTPSARAARLYRRARAAGPDGAVDDILRRAAETDHPEPALVTILAAHGGEEARQLLGKLTRSDGYYRSARSVLREEAIQSAESVLRTARMTIAERAMASLTILDAQPDDPLPRDLAADVLPLDRRDHLADDTDSVIAAVLLAERAFDQSERAALIAGWFDTFTPATQRAAALLLLLSGDAEPQLHAQLKSLMDASEDPAHRSMLRLVLDAVDTRSEPLRGDARNFALRAIRQSAEERKQSWNAGDPYAPDRLAAAALAGLPEALEALATLPAQSNSIAWENRLVLLDRVMPEFTRLFGRPADRDETGIRLWFQAASLRLSMTRHTRTFDPNTRTWSGGRRSNAP